MAYYQLEKLHQLYDGYQRVLRVAGNLELLLIQDQGRLYIVENRCPHMQAPLAGGKVEKGRICCPMHRLTFSLETGRLDHEAPASLCALRRFTPVYEGNTVGVTID